MSTDDATSNDVHHSPARRRVLSAAALGLVAIGVAALVMMRDRPDPVAADVAPPTAPQPGGVVDDTTPVSTTTPATSSSTASSSTTSSSTTTSTTEPAPSSDCPDDRPDDWMPGPDGFSDWSDSVRFDGRSYYREPLTTLDPTELGTVLGHVCFTLSEMTFLSPIEVRDGDAAYLPVGTELRSIPGSDPQVRIAAVTADGVAIFRSSANPQAGVGADLIDLSGDVVEIRITEGEAEVRVATITDPAVIGELIDSLATAPVDNSPDPNRTPGDPVYSTELVRADGTSTNSEGWSDAEQSWPGLVVPPAWVDAIAAALTGAD